SASTQNRENTGEVSMLNLILIIAAGATVAISLFIINRTRYAARPSGRRLGLIAVCPHRPGRRCSTA
ncbi:MAG TPA: hypothetical protein VMT34_17150, partial [Aggregatilineales bacterium]|nr:hypothetical protein [Aggregatilineales bacterium]